MSPESTAPRLVAIVVTHNSSNVLPDFLASLAEGLDGCEPWRLVAVDSGSSDGSADLVRRSAPDAEVVELGRNLGYAASINTAIRRYPDAEAFLVLNPDVRLTPGCGRLLLDALGKPGTGIAVPRLLGPDGTVRHSLHRAPTLGTAAATALVGRLASRFGKGEVITDRAAYEQPTTADWATGAVMCVSQECQERVGEWDESFFLYSEETDLCLRAKDLGFATRLVPEASAVHAEGESRTSPALWSTLVVNKVRLYRRRRGVLPGLVFKLVVLAGELARAALGKDISRAAVRALLSERAQQAELRRSRAQDPSYIFFCASDWWYHNQGHSDFQLALQIARSRDTIIVNSIGMRMPTPGKTDQIWMRLVRKAMSTAKVLRRPIAELPRLRVMSPFVIPLYGSERGRKLSAAVVRTQIRVIMKFLGMNRPVVVVTIPTALPIAESLHPRAMVFNRADHYSSWSEADGDLIGSLERGLLERSDRVVYVARSLMELDAPHVGERGSFLDHGVNLEAFRHTDERPEDVADLQGPIMGFFGSIEDYVVDIDLLEHLAKALPDVTLLLVGYTRHSLDRLTSLPNVRWVGFKPLSEIPAYGSCFDVALMPWNRSKWIEDCNPIKMKEYLALGLPTVSTPFKEVWRYSDYIDVAEDYDGFVEAVRRALDGRGKGTPQSRRDAVRGDSWRQRGAELLALAESVPPRPGR